MEKLNKKEMLVFGLLSVIPSCILILTLVSIL